MGTSGLLSECYFANLRARSRHHRSPKADPSRQRLSFPKILSGPDSSRAAESSQDLSRCLQSCKRALRVAREASRTVRPVSSGGAVSGQPVNWDVWRKRDAPIAAITGHKTLAEVERYTWQAYQELLRSIATHKRHPCNSGAVSCSAVVRPRGMTGKYVQR